MKNKRRDVVIPGIVFLLFLFLFGPALYTAYSAEESPQGDAPAAVEEKAEDAENSTDPGAEFLDQATEAKITASNLDDLGAVIGLCVRAKKAGLSGDNLDYCNQLMSSSQMQRGLVIARAFLDERNGQLPPDAEALRHTALTDLEEAVKTIPDNPQAYYCIARLNFFPGGDIERGKAALDQAIEKAGNDDIDLKCKAILLKALLEEDPDKKTELFREALKANPDSVLILLGAAGHFLEVGLADEAKQLLDHALELEPENALVLGELLNLQKSTSKYEDALQTVEKLEKLLPDNAGILAEKADILGDLEKYDDALAALDAARAKDARSPQILFVRAKIYFFKGELDKAAEDLETLSKEDLPFEIQGRIALLKIDICTKKKEYDEALKILDRLITMVPYPVPLELQKVFILLEKKAGSRALAFVDQMLERPKESFRGSDYAKLLRTRGDVLLNLGKHYEAIKAFKQARELTPDDPGLLNNYAWVLATSPTDVFRDGPLALELAKKAAEKTEFKVAHILSTLGAAYAENGDFDKALEYANKAVELAEKDKEERLEDLKKEVESYKQKKPYRELQEEDEPEEKPE